MTVDMKRLVAISITAIAMMAICFFVGVMVGQSQWYASRFLPSVRYAAPEEPPNTPVPPRQRN